MNPLRKPHSDKTKAKANAMILSGKSFAEVSKATGISVPTLYTYYPGGAKAVREAAKKAEVKPKAKKTAPLKKAA